eukprot:TRINITY_DN78685_c0_g1_i1.p1 TRINITY_DN78685_c0_g1~~TRINITY_DN78685_c0_g1_i1.p1  ORF type:complete len:328 (-),score=29.07 TRINITY_DN78685_c0_g1_i1:61-1044(-)
MTQNNPIKEEYQTVSTFGSVKRSSATRRFRPTAPGIAGSDSDPSAVPEAIAGTPALVIKQEVEDRRERKPLPKRGPRAPILIDAREGLGFGARSKGDGDRGTNIRFSTLAAAEQVTEQRPDGLETIAHQTANFPTALPISINPFDKNNQQQDLNQQDWNSDTLFLIQLPNSLPILPEATATSSSSTHSSPRDKSSTLSGIPSGRCGKLRRHKSGKMSMKIGETEFRINLVKNTTIAQDLWKIAASANPTAYQLGEVKHSMIVTPMLDEKELIRTVHSNEKEKPAHTTTTTSSSSSSCSPFSPSTPDTAKTKTEPAEPMQTDTLAPRP